MLPKRDCANSWKITNIVFLFRESLKPEMLRARPESHALLPFLGNNSPAYTELCRQPLATVYSNKKGIPFSCSTDKASLDFSIFIIPSCILPSKIWLLAFAFLSWLLWQDKSSVQQPQESHYKIIKCFLTLGHLYCVQAHSPFKVQFV